jgi:hypothetical protein
MRKIYFIKVISRPKRRTKMKKNVGSADKVIRIILGVAIIAFGIYSQSWWGLVGIVPLFTAFIGWCPAYNLIGVSTDKKVNVEKMSLKN